MSNKIINLKPKKGKKTKSKVKGKKVRTESCKIENVADAYDISNVVTMLDITDVELNHMTIRREKLREKFLKFLDEKYPKSVGKKNRKVMRNEEVFIVQWEV